jgi:predicted nuclease of predicted toxin-antitoxin system
MRNAFLRFLVDENLPRDIAQLLRQREHDVIYVPDSSLRSAADTTLRSLAASEGRIMITRDLGFRFTERPLPAGFIFLRVPPEWNRGEIASLFSSSLDLIEDEGTGKIMVITPSRIRVRSLS